MPCYSRWTNGSGNLARTLACGQCIGCRLEYARQWAIRCMNEAELYKHNAFITLTYDDDKLPADNGVRYEHFQAFVKKLRQTIARRERKSKTEPTKCKPLCPSSTTENRIDKYLKAENTRTGDTRARENNDKQIITTKSTDKIKRQEKTALRFYMSAEYGEQTGRPHYHALLFNVDFDDKQLLKTTPSGNRIYTSAMLTAHWPHGFSNLGDVTFESAGYVARYVIKKQTGPTAHKYNHIDPLTGEVHQVRPEFSQMSRRPGIGQRWIEKYRSDVYPHGMIVVNGHEVRPPKYYDRWLKTKNPRQHAAMIARRTKETLKNLPDNTNDRLHAKEAVKHAQLNQLKRGNQ